MIKNSSIKFIYLFYVIECFPAFASMHCADVLGTWSPEEGVVFLQLELMLALSSLGFSAHRLVYYVTSQSLFI